MCGGAIISGFIPPTTNVRSRRLTAEYLWPELKRSGNKKYSKPLVDDDFEADFQGFKDEEEESEVDEDDDVDVDMALLADVKPFTFSAHPPAPPPKSRAGDFPRRTLSHVQSNLNQNFNYLNNPDQDYYNSVGLVEEKPPVSQYGFVDPIPVNEDLGFGSFAPATDNTNVYFSSDQGSNSFDCSDFGWGEQGAKTPEISSVLAGTPEVDESQFVEEVANPTKKLKSNSENVVPVEDNNAKSLSDELLAFDNQMKYFQMPYLDGSWDASLDAFLNGDNAQYGGNQVNLWTFDDIPSMSGGVY
ncbi:hypothetical protein Patl1_33830 [Pistacia atlantica]|uniref:Uncharacterized protein n=1 Tax=Pistacia atlantica TaxID=434234 RepID=A0ACC0ZQU5_9ROSI|nr:hypothetical protein Patl1_33830 [Pistacia atlantica]